jgi:nitrate reductase (cytochrome)
MLLTRRHFIKLSAALATASAVGIPLESPGATLVTDAALTQLECDKAPRRVCGVGCAANVGVKDGVEDGQVVAMHGDINAEVNRGINCVTERRLSAPKTRVCVLSVSEHRCYELPTSR